jgi:serine/threonine protein kinase
MPTNNLGRARLPTLDDYELLSIVGRGAIGTVYRARVRATGQMVAVKLLAERWKDHPVMLKRFEQEFTAAQLVRHPNVVQALAYRVTDGIPYLVMEFVDGESLSKRIKRTGPLSEAEAVSLILQVCSGLQAVHQQGIIHRDIKPDNILLTPDGQAKLTDLGLIKDLNAEAELTEAGRGLGTPHYMAPEQFRNAKYADIRSDIYALGATLYTLVTGDIPFKSCGSIDALLQKIRNELPRPRALVPTLSQRVDKLIRRAMSGDPGRRPQSCAEFARRLGSDLPSVQATATEVELSLPQPTLELRPPVVSSGPPSAEPRTPAVRPAVSAARPTTSNPGLPTPLPERKGCQGRRRRPTVAWTDTTYLILTLLTGVVAFLVGLLLLARWR